MIEKKSIIGGFAAIVLKTDEVLYMKSREVGRYDTESILSYASKRIIKLSDFVLQFEAQSNCFLRALICGGTH